MPSSRQAPSIAPRPTPVELAPPSPATDTKGLDPRIVRKREADRKCQRLIRERTKSRIADLEATVKEYERKDVSGLSNLLKQLADARQERDALAKKVQNIEGVLSDGHILQSDTEIIKEGSPDPITSRLSDKSAPASWTREESESRNGSFDESTLVDAPQFSREPISTPATSTFEASSFSKISNSSVQDTYSIAMPIVTDSNMIPTPLQSDQACQCSTTYQRRTQKASLSTWRYANDVLSSRFQWSVDYNNMLSDSYVDDTPVRAVLDGWDAVERCGPMHPSWQILKRIDQALFWRCQPRERLAVLYVMHVLFRSHSDRTISDVPSFFCKGPSDSDPDSYAIKYFTWPGVRQRFLENQHRYCSNDFWALFTRNLRILWPFEFRDCYTRNTETGMYAISPLFRDRVSDLKTWSMGTEIFQRWPELRSDIPIVDSIPASISNRSLARTCLSSAGQTSSTESTHRSTLNPVMNLDQHRYRSQQHRPDTEMQQNTPAVHDQMIWAPMLSPQYDQYNYVASFTTSATTHMAPYL